MRTTYSIDPHFMLNTIEFSVLTTDANGETIRSFSWEQDTFGL